MTQHRITPDCGYREGFKSGAVIALGYLPTAIAFGVLAESAGIPRWTAALMSLLVYAGASQFAGINMMALGVAGWEIVMTTFILNLRHFLMSASLAQRMQRGISRRRLGLLSFGITDETYSAASLSGQHQLSPQYVIALNAIAYASWNAGTWIGLATGAGLPQALQNSMGIALYGLFIGLLVPSLRKSKPAVVVTVLSIVTASLLQGLPLFSGLSVGWTIILSALAAATAGALLFPEKEDRL